MESVAFRSAHRLAIREAEALVFSLGLALLAPACAPSPDNFPDDEHLDIAIASTNPGGGALVADYDFEKLIEVTQSASIGGFTLWSGTDPGIGMLDEDEPDRGLYVLDDGVTVSMELVASEGGARFKFGELTIEEPGDSLLLGTTPELHGHGEWQLVLPSETTSGRYELSFKLTTTSPDYADSQTTTVTLVPASGDGHEHDDDE